MILSTCLHHIICHNVTIILNPISIHPKGPKTILRQNGTTKRKTHKTISYFHSYSKSINQNNDDDNSNFHYYV